jgi:hypothetical protein
MIGLMIIFMRSLISLLLRSVSIEKVIAMKSVNKTAKFKLFNIGMALDELLCCWITMG